jgi:hypothetical protein
MRVAQLQRDDFLSNYLDILPGEHANWISPTGGGKSHFLYQCIGQMQQRFPDLEYVSFMPKLRDESTEDWARRLGMSVTDAYPVHRWPWQAKPSGHVLWPHHIVDDETANREHLGKTFKDVINRLYIQGNSVTAVDDAYLIGVLYGLNPELDRHWTAGRSNGTSLFTTLQKPSGTLQGTISSFAYDSPTHLFLGRDNDDRNLKRFSEIAISQVDPDQVKHIVRNLPVHRYGNSAVSDMLYLDRRGPYMAVITP